MGTKLSHANSQPSNQNPSDSSQKKPTNIELWRISDRRTQDLLELMKNCHQYEEWKSEIEVFLRSTTCRQKYQSTILTVLQFLMSSESKVDETTRKQLFCFYKNKLKYSFFVDGDFNETLIKQGLSSSQKLCCLYQLRSPLQSYVESALSQNYPEIFLEMKKFTQDIIECQASLIDFNRLNRLLVTSHQLDNMKNKAEIQSQFMDKKETEHLFAGIQKLQHIKKLYFEMAQVLSKYSNSQAICNILNSLMVKGYTLSDCQMLFYLKSRIYSTFLYDIGKLNIDLQQMLKMPLVEILHYFYNFQAVEQTPLLQECFTIYNDNGQFWNKSIQEYIFSSKSHISVLVHLVDKNFYKISKQSEITQKLLTKIKESTTDIGKYTNQLNSIISKSDQKYSESIMNLMEHIQLFNQLGFSAPNITIYKLSNKSNLRRQELQQSALQLVKDIITHCLSVKSELPIQIQITAFQIIETKEPYFLFELMKHFHSTLLQETIRLTEINQIILNQVLEFKKYQILKWILQEQNLTKYELQYQILESIVHQNATKQLLTKPFKEVQDDLTIQLALLGQKNLQRRPIASLFQFFKYISSKKMSLSSPSDNITIKDLYKLADQFPLKIESVDFDYLFQLICSIDQEPQFDGKYKISQQYLKFKVYLSHKAFYFKKNKLGNELIDFIKEYQPPWLSTELLKICINNNQLQTDFIMLAFRHCSKGQDLRKILNLSEDIKKLGKDSKNLHFISKKNFKTLLSDYSRYVLMNNQLIRDQSLYRNLVAEMTYSEPQFNQSQHQLFFKLLGTDPERAFHYALAQELPSTFLQGLFHEGMKNATINPVNLLAYLVKYYYFKVISIDSKKVNFKLYQEKSIDLIIQSELLNNTDSADYLYFEKMKKNYLFLSQATAQFLEMDIVRDNLYNFVYEQNFRKNCVVEMREQPMTNPNISTLKKICRSMNIDVIDLSIFSLINSLNTSEIVYDDCWNIAQKLAVWAEGSKQFALQIIQKVSVKVHSLKMLIQMLEYLRQSETSYRAVITDSHIQILSSLAAVEIDKEFHGIIDSSFFKKEIWVHPQQHTVPLSENHRRIVKRSANKTNIFVLAKSLYFMYGMSSNIQKIILSEFSLGLEDCEQFETLRKKLKEEKY